MAAASEEPRSVASAASSIVHDTLDSVKGHPMLIGVIVLNVIFIVVSSWAVEQASDRRHEYAMQLLQRCFPYPDKAPSKD